MASKYWLKLFHETIYDPKVMMRSPGARLRWYECLCLAGDLDRDGELPSIEHMLFVFRIGEEQLLDELSELIRAGLMTKEGDVFIVKNWVKRQGQMPDAERKYRDRDKEQKKEYYSEKVSESVTNTVRNSDADIDIDIDKEGEKEKELDAADTLISTFAAISKAEYVPRNLSERKEWGDILTRLARSGVTDDMLTRACAGRKVTHPAQIMTDVSKYLQTQ
jgi:hypothetical protein